MQARPEQLPPNVVLFLVDDLGWMDLGCQGSSFYETPRTDRLARHGMRLTNAYSACPVCSPSRAALMTGKYPGSVGFTGHITAILRHRYKKHGRIIPPDDYMFLRHRETTLPEALKPAGYVSASIGKWHLGSKRYWPEEQGFDLNVAGYDHGSPPSHFHPYADPDKEWNSRIPTLDGGEPGEYLTDRLTDEAVRFIEDHRDQPFFLYLTHYAVHTPLEAPNDLVRKYEQKLKLDDSQFSAVYAAMVEKVDESLGRIVDTLERFGLRNDTVVIFTSDNGGTQVATGNAPLREGKGYLYEGGIRVPLIVSWPGHVEPGSLCDTPVSGAGRSLFDFTGLLERSRREGWTLVALDAPVDPSSPSGEMLVNLLAAFAQFERRLIGQRTRDALQVVKGRGQRLGRPVDLPNAVRRRIVQQRQEGASLYQIADALTAGEVPTARGGLRWYASTVRGVLVSVEADRAAQAASSAFAV